jgi:uncharacterized protein
MTTRNRTLALLMLAALALPLASQAQEENLPDATVISSEGFLGAHPDLKYRQEGLKAYTDGDHGKAMELFKRAARFADKPSQGMIAEMLWRGEGVAQDRPAAYAWMDLAGERHFRTMLIQREKYWEVLSPEEREQAVKIGEGLYAEYGDVVAQPRLERKLRFARRKTTGSRTGFTGTLKIVIDTLAGPVTINGADYYHPDYWEPARYWQWQESGWKDPPRGVVDVGPLSAATTTAPAEAKPADESK